MAHTPRDQDWLFCPGQHENELYQNNLCIFDLESLREVISIFNPCAFSFALITSSPVVRQALPKKEGYWTLLSPLRISPGKA
jgi:hypothetical protein